MIRYIIEIEKGKYLSHLTCGKTTTVDTIAQATLYSERRAKEVASSYAGKILRVEIKRSQSTPPQLEFILID